MEGPSPGSDGNTPSPAGDDDSARGAPKTLAFTIDFDSGSRVDEERHKALVRKFQNRAQRHRRGQSLTKLDADTTPDEPLTVGGISSSPRRPSTTGTKILTRQPNSDERTVRKFDLPLMTRSFPDDSNHPSEQRSLRLEFPTPSPTVEKSKMLLEFCTALTSKCNVDGETTAETENNNFTVDTTDKSDAVSDAGTYTLETDNYTEEQKARMSIDRDFNIEEISVMRKTEEYIQSLNVNKNHLPDTSTQQKSNNREPKNKLLSPILSPTQNLSIVDQVNSTDHTKLSDSEVGPPQSPKIMYPSAKSKLGINSTAESVDQGCFTSVTSSGAFSRRPDSGKQNSHSRQPSLTKSEIQVLTYVEIEPVEGSPKVASLPPAIGGKTSPTKIPSPVHSGGSNNRPRSRNSLSSLNIDLSDSSLETESFLKPTQNYINSLQKRLSLDSDSSDYDCGKGKCNNVRLNNAPETQKSLHIRHNSFDERNATKITNKLEHFQNKCLQQQHHQGIIDQTYSNKLNQYAGLKQHHQQQHQNKLQNSPNHSPIKRSSSFSNKNHFINVQPKVSNFAVSTSSISKDNNLRNSPNLNENGSIQRSSSTVNIKLGLLSRCTNAEQLSKVDRSQFADTESSSEDDFEKKLLKKKDFSNLTNTRYNRAFSLRRARLDGAPSQSIQPRCPNTPEMRRKFQPPASERSISVDRRPLKNDVPSRYLQIGKSNNLPGLQMQPPKNVPKPIMSTNKNCPPGRSKQMQQSSALSRVDSGRFNARPVKSAASAQKSGGVGGKKQSGGRSNSSLSSREVEFQNWKRRKSYDPMKAAAEGKKKAEMAKRQSQGGIMSQSYNQNSQDCDSSPSHSSSVHRSQSFHGTAALEQLISSEEDDLTLSADEGFSPPTPSPRKLSPTRTVWKNRLLY